LKKFSQELQKIFQELQKISQELRKISQERTLRNISTTTLQKFSKSQNNHRNNNEMQSEQ